MVRAIVGANWGDEGKGKITDMLASESDIVVRFQGGANAGHTIINDYGRFALHLLPSGVCTPGVVNVLGPGVALDIEFFLKELASIEEQGLPAPKILISERAQVLMPYHVALDCYEEERLGKNSFGSTKSGIAPCYGDKFQKIGLQLCQLYYPDVLREKLAHALDIKNAMIVNLYHREPVDLEALIVKLTELAERIRPLHDAGGSRGQEDPAGGSARHAPRPGSRYLPDGHVLLAAGRLRPGGRGRSGLEH